MRRPSNVNQIVTLRNSIACLPSIKITLFLLCLMDIILNWIKERNRQTSSFFLNGGLLHQYSHDICRVIFSKLFIVGLILTSLKSTPSLSNSMLLFSCSMGNPKTMKNTSMMKLPIVPSKLVKNCLILANMKHLFKFQHNPFRKC